MLASERDQLQIEIHRFAERFEGTRVGLMPILHHIQNKYRHISPYAMQEVAEAFGIHPVEVQGVVSFYSFFSTEKKGKFIIRLCRTISCDMAGKEGLARQLENELGIRFGQTTKDGLFTLEYTNCLGMCDMGPALLVNDEVFTRVTPEHVPEIIEHCTRKFAAHVTSEEDPAHHG
jgi:[NiFe] hydrogenase diaphorase moiety large subunit